MKPPDTFTAALVRWLLRDPLMPETVRQWRQKDLAQDEREVRFAEVLQSDFVETFTFIEEKRGPNEASVINQLFVMVGDRVNWRRVARALLRHFTTPVLLSMIVNGDRWRRPPADPQAVFWNGPVN